MKGPPLIVVAHPDDETLAFFSVMRESPDCVVLHITDGSPLHLRHAQAAGFRTRDEYAAARRGELDVALAVLGGRETRQIGMMDQESWRDLSVLTDSIHEAIQELRPRAIYTHPYEGGHPDHDSAAFAVARAVTRSPVEVIEGAFYNGLGGPFQTGEFLPSDSPVTEHRLSWEEWLIKRRMLDCFASQAGVLSLFHPEIERERRAPAYDVTAPPHPGTLNYETLGWDVTGAMWREAARKALGL